MQGIPITRRPHAVITFCTMQRVVANKSSSMQFFALKCFYLLMLLSVRNIFVFVYFLFFDTLTITFTSWPR